MAVFTQPVPKAEIYRRILNGGFGVVVYKRVTEEAYIERG
jgi:hypothetical protein